MRYAPLQLPRIQLALNQNTYYVKKFGLQVYTTLALRNNTTDTDHLNLFPVQHPSQPVHRWPGHQCTSLFQFKDDTHKPDQRSMGTANKPCPPSSDVQFHQKTTCHSVFVAHSHVQKFTPGSWSIWQSSVEDFVLLGDFHFLAEVISLYWRVQVIAAMLQ